MIIGKAVSFTEGSLAGLKWSVAWADNARPAQEIYIAVSQEHAHLLSVNDHVGLLSALPVAARYGEPEVRVGSADPTLLEGLDVVQAYFHEWQGLKPVSVETDGVRGNPTLAPERSTAVFLSGGIDSLSTLRRNYDNYPSGHVGRITHALHVDLAGPEDLADLRGQHRIQERAASKSLGKCTADLGVQLVSVVTNIRALDSYDFHLDWMFHSHGTILAAIGHAFEKSFNRVLIASTYDVAHLTPWGSHPLIDRNLSSSSFRIEHHNEQFSRQQKVELIANWPAAFESLDVCFRWADRTAGERNCGRCEKCQRTIAGLTLAGIDVSVTGAFEETTFSASTLRRLGWFTDEYERDSWRELYSGLKAQGSTKASAVAELLAKDKAAQLLNNRYGQPLLNMAKTTYKKVRDRKQFRLSGS